MRKNVQLRWIEEAEARSVRENARVQRAASEPRINLACTRGTGPAWFGRLRRLVPRVAWAIANARSFPVNTTIQVKARFSAELRNSSTEVDSDRILATVLITDIVDSTKRVAEIGDRHWRALLDRHNAATRYQIKRFGGRGVRNRGDGFFAIFDSPAQSAALQLSLRRSLRSAFSVRSGIHVGKIHLKRDGTMNPIEPQDFMKGQRPESSRSRSPEMSYVARWQMRLH
jgi:hypothetical protein